jgi:hypothetical protein
MVSLPQTDLGPVSASPHAVVAAALDLARVGPGDVFFDVGCGANGASILAWVSSPMSACSHFYLPCCAQPEFVLLQRVEALQVWE